MGFVLIDRVDRLGVGAITFAGPEFYKDCARFHVSSQRSTCMAILFASLAAQSAHSRHPKPRFNSVPPPYYQDKKGWIDG
eukprot:451222-Rhodomonas_salina.3